ncbi:MAG: hypothetical protein P1P76_03510 [Anaerolineales bacterium]|nr:hypothetical protein [Anaerolineales bacterium]
MTRNRSSAIYILLVAIVCFAAGVASVLLRDDFSRSRPDNSSSTPTGLPVQETQAPFSEKQITVVIFGVDDLSLKEPQLQALWLASFEPPDKEVHLLGVPVTMTLDGGKASLQERFSLFEPPDYGASFLTSLAELAPYPIHGFVVLDEEGFAVLIDYVGGVILDSQDLNGAAAIGALTLLKDQPLASLRMQARLLTSLTESAASIGRTPELTLLTSLVPEHAYTSPSPYQLASIASQLLPIDPARITIEIQIPE